MCGYYTLLGIPCLRSIASVSYLRLDLEEFVHDLYKCSSVAKAYSYDVPTLVGNKHALMPLDTPYFHHQEGGFLVDLKSLVAKS
ncbi:hypothetical protein LINPERPRIM_LOCUS20785 [Linum perenne]